MKINIVFEFKDGPWGGGNQFLKALKDQFTKKNKYIKDPAGADIILFNSHHNLFKVILLKLKFPDKKFVHRIDGPIFLIRNKNLYIDKTIFKISEMLADLSIFQSKWSLKKSEQLGYNSNNYAIIKNAPDNLIFNKKNSSKFSQNKKVKIIATSWSGNWKKGFDVYDYLDKNLDFDRFNFTFVGNSPIKFEKINLINPLPSKKLAKIIRESDIFITASKNDPCSNSLIEALSCGLPAVVYNDGGHPELINKGGETFNNKGEAIAKLNKIAKNYKYYKNNLPSYDIEKTSQEYLKVFKKIKFSKKISRLEIITVILLIAINKLKLIIKIK